MNKVLIKLYVPIIEEKFEVWIPVDKKLSNVIQLLIKGIKELTSGYYKPTSNPKLYNKLTGCRFDNDKTVMENNIENASEVILI